MPVINTNINALAAQESSRSSGLKMSQAMERLSTGLKINSAKDDSAGLAISNRMTSQIRGMAKAIQNTNDAISMTQTAEGAYGNVSEILQRMRELAVQSGSGTNTDADRQSLQLEVSQLKAQVDVIANNTNHNNIKLLDGSAQKVVIQTNINSGDTMALSFASVKTKDIGVGSRAVLSSAGGVAASNAAITANTLLINGVAVGSSKAVDDNASPASEASASSIAKAAAINAVASLSGVYAKADVNTVSGSSMTAAASSFTVTINGVATSTITTTSDNTSLNRKLVVNAINAISAQSGVVATDTGDDTLGLTLTAADGRNIVTATTATTVSTIGISSATTNIGSFSLYTLDNRDININTVSGADGLTAISTSGLRVGTYKSDTALMTSYLRSAPTSTAAPATGTTGLLDNSTMIINGVAIGQALTTDDTASDTTTTSSTRAASAIAIASAINRSTALTGVTASATPNVIRGTGFTASTASNYAITVNGTSITANTNTRNGVIDSINSYAGQTGVVASAFGDGIQLVAQDGRNISLATLSGSAGNFGLSGVSIGASVAAATTYYSQVTLSSANKFTIQAGKTGITNLQNLGFRQGTFGGSDNGLKVNQLDISTASGAQQALVAIDAALNTVSQAQATSGALNNRLDVVINNLSEASQNISASRSRITDTDYATETTNLAKQQIIAQAATAMLAQANQQGQMVLSLLK
jgi:flagellin